MGEDTRPRGRAKRLDLRQITRAAIELLDEVGLAELSTRRLAAKLGVRSPTLYWHVRDKAELLDLVAEAICADAFDIDTTLPWRDQLADGLRQFRNLLLSHRDAAALLRERPPSGPHRLGHIETTVRILLEAGFPEHEAAGISRLLAAHVLNSAQEETRALIPPEAPGAERAPTELAARLRDFPQLRRIAPAYTGLSGADLFELGIEIILDGLEHRAARDLRSS
ncbi:TetR/AcrR family transcriptional regulator C-terminal domain-containing protein [Amycolatopsis anabasis]|uniref:TetR/AcrR family transcriptional regulator C-terminal domain-containing protein n=1 Tax=Amycolatopsis anabasis TaxID=1840409 RepID=UPI00131D4E05|nr:TetR/AcrR family transcriptional regulator C-terminal domain-containing protein [Amycolatopsis anabasis]